MLWCNSASAETVKELLLRTGIEALAKCQTLGDCTEERISKLKKDLKKLGFAMKSCSYVNYEAPCTCEYEKTYLKKKYCELKMKPGKKTRMQATDYCSKLSNRQNKEVRQEYFKSCMKDQGYR